MCRQYSTRGEGNLLVVGCGNDHGSLPGRKGSHVMGQTLIGREDIGGKLLFPKIRYLSWGPRRTIRILQIFGMREEKDHRQII